MGRGTNQQIAGAVSSKPRQRPGDGHASARLQHDGKPFAATILFKMFPKKGQPEKDDFFTIAKARHETTGEEISLKGKFGPVVEGQLIQVKRYKWVDDARWGESVLVFGVSHDDPVTHAALIAYLSNLPGVGEKLADAIIAEYGEGCLAKIDADPSLLQKVKLNGRGTNADLDELTKKWEELRADRKNMLYLSSLGIGDATAKKISSHFGVSCIEIVQKDPYQMTQVKGVGFKVADQVGQKVGIGSDDPRRLAAGVEYLLQVAEGDGHICLKREDIMERAPKLLARDFRKPSAAQLEEAIEQMVMQGRLWRETDETDGAERIYTTEHYVVETRLYDNLEKLLTAERTQLPDFFKKREDSPVTDQQWNAVENAFRERLSILTGGPGCGKTFTLKTMLDELDQEGQTYKCFAPTGKAAKRMAESTGRDASTIHRALGWHGREAPGAMKTTVKDEDLFDADVVIVDESSMLDMRLAERVTSHLRPDARLVLVGDPDQLPAVGAGSVLLDLIESDRVPVVKLDKVFRQAEGSLLVVNSHRIKDGLEPYWTKEEAEEALGHPVKEDWKFIEVNDANAAISETMRLAEQLPQEMGISQDDVMVTAPSRKGGAGVFVLNQALQRKRNPDGFQFRDGDQPLRVGDNVMNTQNRYGKKGEDGEMGEDIMNGDIGRVESFNAQTKTAWVDFGTGDLQAFPGREEIDKLIPSYAATTHKLQGSEAPAIITPLVGNGDGSAGRMLSRNLLYTAQTRAKEQCVVVGSKDVIREAVKRDGSRRNTTLDLRVGRIKGRVLARWEVVEQHIKKYEGVADILYGRR